MWVQFLLGATLVGILLYTEREHMASGVYSKTTPPTDAEINDIFDQIMAMSPYILHNAYADALVFAQAALVEGKRLATLLPNDQSLKTATTTSSSDLVKFSKMAVVLGVLSAREMANNIGRSPSEQVVPGMPQGPVTEEKLKVLVNKAYDMINEHINDKFGNDYAIPSETPAQADVRVKTKEYVEKARALVKKYDTPEVRDACLFVLKEYYIDQLNPSWTPAGRTAAPDPTASGNMADLEAEYQKRKIIYDNLVADALAKNDTSKVDAIARAKVAMNESLNKMLELSAKSGTESQQQELIHRIMEIQRDYNGLLTGTDKLQTLRLLHQSLDVRDSAGLKVLGVVFLLATLALLVQVMRTH